MRGRKFFKTMKEFLLGDFDAAVIGAGHAGCEAALALARTGLKTAMLTLNLDSIAFMACNPSIGGTAKGHLVREIDALGGEMGINADATSLQFKMLNAGKGAAVQSLRCQSDKNAYHARMKGVLENTENLRIIQGEAAKILVDGGAVAGVLTTFGGIIKCRAAILATGVYLNARTITGEVICESGPNGFSAACALTRNLISLGFNVRRFKTGTPARLDGRTIDLRQLSPQYGEDNVGCFSFLTKTQPENKLPCYLGYTNADTHKIINDNLDRAPLYNGAISSTGPRYCPSIETKIVTFADKTEHQLFLEPEGETTQEFYLNGFSSSLPMKVQIEALHTIPALADVQIYRPGYAIEYDFFDPTQLKHTLETRLVQNLYFAGQINGTTGYEEAAGQGLVAGVNAALRVQGKNEFVLGRDEAYIGVLIDDLVNKGVDEPYRMFTSRAEYRILLRQDDADMRLTPRGYEIGLATQERFDLMAEKREWRDRLIDFARNLSVKPAEVNSLLEEQGSSPLTQGVKLVDLIARPQLSLPLLVTNLDAVKEFVEAIPAGRRDEIIEAAEILIKYRGYIERERANVDKLHRLEEVRIPERFDYESVKALSTEARQKLTRHRPATIGQASRIPGISPSDVSILLLLMNR